MQFPFGRIIRTIEALKAKMAKLQGTTDTYTTHIEELSLHRSHRAPITIMKLSK